MFSPISPRIALRIQTFGDLAVRGTLDDEGPTVHRKPLALLAIVAAHEPSGISRERLLLLLWPESTPDRARHSLNHALYVLRGAFGFDPVVGTGSLRLAAALSADIVDVRRTLAEGRGREGAAMVDTGFLEGVSFPGCVEFQQWVDEVRASLAAAVVAALTAEARAASSGGVPEAVECWSALARRCPDNAALAKEAASAIAARGEVGRALRVLRDHADYLRRELEVDPDPGVTALMERLRRPSPASPPVTESAGSGDPVTELPDHPPAPPPTGPPVSGTLRPRRRGLIAAALAAALVGIWQWTSTPPAARRPTETVLLVAPFRFDGDPQRAYLARSLAEEVAMRLQPFSGLRVFAPGTIRTGDSVDLAATARAMNADVLLEGAVQAEVVPSGMQLRVRCRLLSVRDRRVLWKWAGDGQMDRLIALRMMIADSTARNVATALSGAVTLRLRAVPTRVPEAYDYYLRAQDYLRQGRDGLPTARDLLGRAIALDSGFALALARYGEVQARLHWYGFDRDSARMREAHQLITRAVALDPQLAEARLADAFWWLYDRRAYDSALAQLDTALALSPYNSAALEARAQIRRRLGRWKEAAADYRAAAHQDPASYALALELGNTLLLMRRFDEAQVALERARTLAPDAADPVAWLAALAVRAGGDTLRALRLLEEGMRTTDPRQLYARVALSFPELHRILHGAPFAEVSDVSLREAYGDSVSLALLRADHAPSAEDRRRHLATAMRILRTRIAATPDNFGPRRVLSRVQLEAGDAGALASATEARRLMAVDGDAMAGPQTLLTLAEAEAAFGPADSARVHACQLLRIPSPISRDVIRLDPAWSRMRGRDTLERLAQCR